MPRIGEQNQKEEPVTCHDYITQHAGPLAQAVRHFLAREIPYHQLEDLSWQLLSHWQALPVIPMDKTPANEREGVFWHLLHSLQGGRTGAAGIGIGRKIPARHAQGIGATVLQRGHWRIQYSIHTAKIIATPASPIRLKAVFSP